MTEPTESERRELDKEADEIATRDWIAPAVVVLAAVVILVVMAAMG